MKKTIVILSAFCFLLLAQNSLAISFGAKIGINQTSQDFKFSQFGDLGQLDKSGAEVGLFFEFPLVSTFSISTEFRYLQKGEQFDYFTWAGNQPNPSSEVVGRLSYVSFIALAKLRLPLNSFNFYGLIGPRFDFKVGPKEVVGFELFSDSYQSPIAGSIIGAGMEFKLGGVGWFLIEGYYSFDWKKAWESAELDIETQTAGILIGLRTL